MIAVPEPPAAATGSTSAAPSTGDLVWYKSSFSGASGDCVEVALTSDRVLVRDSESPGGPLLSFTFTQWDCFLEGVRRGEFDALRG
jgi:hypothetical protein